MDRRRREAAGGVGKDDRLVLTALIAALIGLGAQQNVAEGYANDYVKTHAISAQYAVQQYVTDAVIQIASQVSDTLCQETKRLEEFLKGYIRMFSKEPYLGLPIREMSLSLFDQFIEIKHRIHVLKDAIFSRHPIPEEPMQEMGAGLPPPIFCTGSNHCAIASMLSLISVTCMLLGYTGNAPPKSFSIVLGDFFKSALKIRQDRCIVIENIFANLQIFLCLLGEQFPPYSPFLDRIFSVFSSRTFSKNSNGTCSLHEGSKEVLSSLKMLEESIQLLGDRLQHALLSCGSEHMHSHLHMDPRFISAFGLPCASLDIDLFTCVVQGLLPQIPFTAESMASFQLFGKTVGSGLQFDIKSNLFAAICDTQGRNSTFAAEQVDQAGTSHYYIVISYDGKFFLVDSLRTHVQEISQYLFLENVNVNGIVIFMRNQNSNPELSSSSSAQKLSAGGGTAAVSAQPSPSCRKPSVGGGADAVPHQPPPFFRHAQPPQRSSARGGEVTILHKPSGSFGHSQCTSASKSQPWMERLQENFENLFIQHLIDTAVKSSGKYNPSHHVATDLAFLFSIAFDVKNLRNVDSAFIYDVPSFTLCDFTTRHNIVTSFPIGKQMFRCTAVVFSDGNVIARPELKDLQKDNPRRDELRDDFHQEIKSYFQRFPRLVIDKMLIEPCA